MAALVQPSHQYCQAAWLLGDMTDRLNLGWVWAFRAELWQRC